MPEIKGKIKWIDPTTVPAEGKTFIKRNFCLMIETVDHMMDVHINHINMQLLGNSDKPQYDKTKQLDGINVGDEVNVKFVIQGTCAKKDGKPSSDQNPEGLDGFNNITAVKIERVGGSQNQPTPAPATAPNPPTSAIPDKKAEWDKQQADLRNKEIDHPGMMWSDSDGMWVEDPF